MSIAKVWRPVPLQTRIIEILRGASNLTDEELAKALEKEGEEVTPEVLSKVLLQLEVRGLIRVSNAPRGRKKIELRR